MARPGWNCEKLRTPLPGSSAPNEIRCVKSLVYSAHPFHLSDHPKALHLRCGLLKAARRCKAVASLSFFLSPASLDRVVLLPHHFLSISLS